MRLKNFETFGFKSFADKTELSFDKGITAIVGPNGSGKSNISDAIRWVLGEQSSKNLRGGKMEDVIFSGTAKRRQLGLAEVNLVFDNTDHQLPLEFDEVCLTRRLYRSGDSEYQINKKNVRLKDIIDLMADTGLGKGSMSIIGQNKIDEILNSRPEERRTIFEEAAGISKYRMRKKEAMRKLEETGTNLIRINDIKTEIENQVAPMKEAAEKTMKFNELDGLLKQVRLTEFMRKIDNVETTRQKLLDKQENLQNELTVKQTELGQKEALALELKHAWDKLNEDFANLQGVIAEKQTALEHLRGEMNVLEERAEQSQRNSIRLEEKNKTLTEQIKTNQEILDNTAQEFDNLEMAHNALKQKLSAKQEERNATQARYDAAYNEQNDSQSSYFKGMEELLALRSELETLKKEQEERVKQREGLKEVIETLEAQAEDVETRGKSITDELARVERDRDRFNAELAELKNTLGAQNENVANQANGKAEAERRLAMAETRLNTLEQMQESYDGFGNGIRTVLKAQAAWRNKIIGVAAELIKVDPKIVTAIETALGDGAQNIVTEDAETAKTAIRFLKEQNAGRATFLPLDTVEPRALRDDEMALANLPGVLGFAFDLIECEPVAEKALRFLLGRILVAENLDVALDAAKEGRFHLKVVTLDGDVVNAGGSMTGGARRQREGYLSREKTIEKLNTQVAQLESEVLAWQEKLEAAQDIAGATAKRERELTENVSKGSLRVKELQLEAANLQREKNEADANLAAALGDRTEVANMYMAQRDRVKELRNTLTERENMDQGAKEKLDELSERIKHEQTNLNALDNVLAEIKVEIGKNENDMKYKEDRMRDLDNSQVALQEEIAKNDEERERLAALVVECNTQRQEMATKQDAMMADLAESSGGKEKFLEQRAEAQAKYEEADQVALEFRRTVSAADAKVHQIDVDLARANADYEHALEQLDMEYHMTIEDAHKTDLLEDSDRELSRKERDLTNQIIELGPVNPAAVEEYDAVKERAELYQKQYADLVTAKENLETVIAEINEGMISRFNEAFQQINTYFVECYQELFGGGTASLKLIDPNDTLESGIDIEAQPPGKKTKGLFLLSGGERALTVIALLFALLRYQPSPFCILDEIDAPLDDANIGRFSSFLHNYAQKTQFIVITHRKGTMESADIMYGVTMEESGVSKLLSVKISDAANQEGMDA